MVIINFILHLFGNFTKLPHTVIMIMMALFLIALAQTIAPVNGQAQPPGYFGPGLQNPNPNLIRSLTLSFIQDLQLLTLSNSQGGGGGGIAGCGGFAERYIDNSTTITFFSKSIHGSDEFVRYCLVGATAMRTRNFNCQIILLEEDTETSVIRCDASGTVTRSNNDFTSLMSMTVLKWNSLTQKLQSIDTSVSDVQQFLNVWFTNAEKYRWRMTRAFWEGGFDGASQYIAHNCTLSLPNLLLRPSFASGIEKIRNISQGLLQKIDLSVTTVTNMDVMYGSTLTSALMLDVSIIMRATGRELQRRFWTIANFGNDGKLYSMEVIANQPLMFWDLSASFESQSGGEGGGGGGSGERVPPTSAMKSTAMPTMETGRETGTTQGGGGGGGGEQFGRTFYPRTPTKPQATPTSTPVPSSPATTASHTTTHTPIPNPVTTTQIPTTTTPMPRTTTPIPTTPMPTTTTPMPTTTISIITPIPTTTTSQPAVTTSVTTSLPLTTSAPPTLTTSPPTLTTSAPPTLTAENPGGTTSP